MYIQCVVDFGRIIHKKAKQIIAQLFSFPSAFQCILHLKYICINDKHKTHKYSVEVRNEGIVGCIFKTYCLVLPPSFCFTLQGEMPLCACVKCLNFV